MTRKPQSQRVPLSSLQALRTLNHLLTTTPVTQLPTALATADSYIISILRVIPLYSYSNHSEVFSLLHNLCTRSLSLLEDRSPDAKLAAVILIHSLLYSSSAAASSTSPQNLPNNSISSKKDSTAVVALLATNGLKWIDGLIKLIKQPNSVACTTRALAIRTATFLLVLAEPNAELARELVKLHLSSLVNAALDVTNLIDGNRVSSWATLADARSRKDVVLQAVLQCLIQLLPRYPGTMKHLIGSIIEVTQKVIAHSVEGVLEKTEDEEKDVTGEAIGSALESIKELARRVYVLLHKCATKTGTLPDRDAGCKIAIEKTIKAVEECFSVLFDPEHLQFEQRSTPNTPMQSLALLSDQIAFVRAYITTPSQESVAIPIGKLAQLIQLTSQASSSMPAPQHSELTKLEREKHLLGLPYLHMAIIQLCVAIITRFETAALSISIIIQNALVSIFNFNKQIPFVRATVYQALVPLLKLVGPTLSLSQTTELAPIVRFLCDDLILSRTAISASSSINPVNNNNHVNQYTSITHKNASSSSSTPSSSSAVFSQLTKNVTITPANALLPILFSLPWSSLANSSTPASETRARLDRTAILTQKAKALAASVLYSTSLYSDEDGSSTSILPLAMRCEGVKRNRLLEAVLRPRMRAVKGMSTDVDVDTDAAALAGEMAEGYEMKEDNSDEGEEEEEKEKEKEKEEEWQSIEELGESMNTGTDVKELWATKQTEDVPPIASPAIRAKHRYLDMEADDANIAQDLQSPSKRPRLDETPYTSYMPAAMAAAKDSDHDDFDDDSSDADIEAAIKSLHSD